MSEQQDEERAFPRAKAGMTPAELREAVMTAQKDAEQKFLKEANLSGCAFDARKLREAVADAALRVVREAMREATPAMCAAWECSAILGPHASFEELAKRDWATMLAASPLREE